MSGPFLYHLGGFPPTGIDRAALVPPGAADAALARYDGLVAAIPNAAVVHKDTCVPRMLRKARPAVGRVPWVHANACEGGS